MSSQDTGFFSDWKPALGVIGLCVAFVFLSDAIGGYERDSDFAKDVGADTCSSARRKVSQGIGGEYGDDAANIFCKTASASDRLLRGLLGAGALAASVLLLVWRRREFVATVGASNSSGVSVAVNSSLSPDRQGQAERTTGSLSLTPRPSVENMPLVEDRAGLQPDHIRNYVADNEQFWTTFHAELVSPHGAYRAHSRLSLADLRKVANGDAALKASLRMLADYPVLKGEYVLAHGGAGLLTNYRFQLSLDGKTINVPLSQLETYDLSKMPQIVYSDAFGRRIEVSFAGTAISNLYVNGALAAGDYRRLDANQSKLLNATWYDLDRLGAGITPIRVNPSG